MISEHKFIQLKDGIELHTQIKEMGGPIWIVAVHGIGEHLERHSYITELFGHDFNILQYDLRGHGRSMGKSAYIENFSQYREDLLELINFLKTNYKMRRYALFGHSMGGLISLDFLSQGLPEDLYPEKVFINAPPIGFAGGLGQIIKYSHKNIWKYLSSFSPSVKLGGLVDLDNLSHDPYVKETYLNDPLVCSKLHTKLLFELVSASKRLSTTPINPKCPAFCTIGSADTIVNFQALKTYFKTVETNFTFKVFDGAYHEIHQEIERFRLPYFKYLKNTLMDSIYNDAPDD